ncbi:hypothetical protein MBANPS3_006623 [Mucor bainieri]
MSTALSFSHTDPVSIPNNNNNNNNSSNNDDDEQAYKDMIKQLAAQAPEPYGAIPPLTRRKDKDKSKQKKKKKKRSRKDKKTPIRRMSHVENWLAVDSKESIPDEEDLVHSSPFRNFLSTDFLVLPLHMPPPSLSATVPDEEMTRPSIPATPIDKKDLRPVLFPIKQPPIQVIPITDSRLMDDDDEDDDEEDAEEDEEDGEEDDEDEEEDEDDDETTDKMLNRKRSIPSFSKSQQPSTSMTRSYAMSTSPPSSSSSSTSTAVMSTSASSTSSTEQEPSKSRWLETIAQLRRSLTLSNSRQQQQQQKQQAQRDSSDTNPSTSTSSSSLSTRKSNFIPMPLPPKRNVRKKRRSEATTQPRFNPETNTYTRDTRSNPDHLRMISAELNMMRHRKLSSPLKPRGFLPRRTDAFIRGQQRKLSALKNEL